MTDPVIEHPGTLLRLPDDCLLQVLTAVDSPLDVLALRLTCQRLSNLSREQIVWRSQIQWLEINLGLPRFFKQDLEAPAEELERLATTRFRLRTDLRHNRLQSHVVQECDWAHARLDQSKSDSSDWSHEVLRTSAWISPGWLLSGSAVDQGNHYTSCMKLWNTGHAAMAEPLQSFAAECRLPSLTGSIFEIVVSKDDVEENSYLVLTGHWMRSAWALLRARLPRHEGEAPLLKEIDSLIMPHAFHSTAVDVRGDYAVLLSDIAGTRGSIFLWNWRSATCLRFKMDTLYDFDPYALSATDGSSPIIIMPPYIIYVRTNALTLHILPIPEERLTPLSSYPILALPVTHIPTWSTRLPWKSTDDIPEIQFSVVANDDTRTIICVEFCRNRRTSQCKVVVSKGSSTQCILGNDVTFDFDVRIEEVHRDDNPLLIGRVGIRGSAGWLTPHEVDYLLRRVLRLPEFSMPVWDDDKSNTTTQGTADLRLYCSEDGVKGRVALDPVLGRLSIIANGSRGKVHLVDVV